MRNMAIATLRRNLRCTISHHSHIPRDTGTQRELRDAHALIRTQRHADLYDRLMAMPEPSAWDIRAAAMLAAVGR